MTITAKLNYLRIAPRKVRLVANLIRKKKVEQAQIILNFANKKSAPALLKLLNSAVADAKNNFRLDPKNLYISKITVNEGPKHKRWRARARGSTFQIQKKTSHIKIVLEEIKPTKRIKKVKKIKPTVIKEKAKTIDEVKQETGLREESPEKKKEEFEKEVLKPKQRKGIRRFFRRKAF